MTILKHVFGNKPKGAQYNLPQYHVPADRIMENYYTLEDALGQGKILGLNCANNGSTNTEARLLCKTAYGIGNLIVAGDVVWIWENGTSNVWRVVVDDEWATDELRFGYRGANDHDQLSGTLKTSGYDQTAFHNSLKMARQPFPNVAIGADLATLGPNKPTGDDLEVSASDSTKIGTQVAENKTRLGNIADEDGLKEGAVSAPSKIAEDVYLHEGFVNLIRGAFDADGNLDGVADGWFKYNSPTTVELDTSKHTVSDHSQKVVAGQAQDGIYTKVVAPNLYTDFAGKNVAIGIDIEVSENETVKIEIYDGVNTTTSAAGGTAGEFVRLGLVHITAANPTTLEVRAYATTATTFWADGGSLRLGCIKPGFSYSPSEVVAKVVAQTDFTNWMLNSDFEEWTDGDDELPNFWKSGDGGVNMPTAINKETGAVEYGNASCKFTLNLGEGAYIDVPNYENFAGDTVYVGAFLKGVSGAGKITLKLEDGINTGNVEYALDTSGWKRPNIRMKVDDSPTRLRFLVKHEDGSAGALEFLIDADMLTRVYDFDIAPDYTPAAHYHPVVWTFALEGSLTDGYMAHQGVALDIFPVPFDCVIHKILIRENTAGSGIDTFTVRKNGVDTSLAKTLDSGIQDAKKHEPVDFNEGERLQVYIDADETNPGTDAGVTVEAYKFAY